MKVTYELACRLFYYNPDSGELIPTDPNYRARISSGGYVRIALHGTQFLAHRLIWLLVTGSFPPDGYEIDHINGIKHDNRWENLRCVTRTENQRNQLKANSTNRLGLRGISWVPAVGKYRVRIFAAGKQHNVGYFETLEGAIAARTRAVQEYHA